MPEEFVDTLIIGAGQAGLAMSQQLRLRGCPHLVLERGRIGERWLSERWVGMHFQTPNALVRLCDVPMPHDDPDGFSTAAEIADFLADFARTHAGEVRQGVPVERLCQDRRGFIAATPAGAIVARQVVVATGPFQQPRMPDLIPADASVRQLPASAYRAPDQLPPGGVLVVGAGASGAQIAEELMRAGRSVWLSVSRHRRAPRRYRGRDHIWWWIETGMDKTPPERRGPDQSPVVHRGAFGGRTIDFRAFAAEGMRLTGRVSGYADGAIRFAPDLMDNLAHGDAAFLAFMDFVDAHIAREGLDFPSDPGARALVPAPPSLARPIAQVNLREQGIGTVIWATGYTLGFPWIELPIFDAAGMPAHQRGVTSVPGLFFLGLPWMSKFSSSFLFGVGDDAARLAAVIAERSAPG